MSEKSTRANIPAPPSTRQKFLPTRPTSAPAENMSGQKIASMTFNMDQDWHREFKMTAAQQGVSMKELLVECFEAWKKANQKAE